jgi:hypothetical protein
VLSTSEDRGAVTTTEERRRLLDEISRLGQEIPEIPSEEIVAAVQRVRKELHERARVGAKVGANDPEHRQTTTDDPGPRTPEIRGFQPAADAGEHP